MNELRRHYAKEGERKKKTFRIDSSNIQVVCFGRTELLWIKMGDKNGVFVGLEMHDI